MTYSPAEALSAALIIKARALLGIKPCSAFIFFMHFALTFALRSNNRWLHTRKKKKKEGRVKQFLLGGGAHPIELRGWQAAATGYLRARAEVGHGWALGVAEPGKPLAVVGVAGELLG